MLFRLVRCIYRQCEFLLARLTLKYTLSTATALSRIGVSAAYFYKIVPAKPAPNESCVSGDREYAALTAAEAVVALQFMFYSRVT